MYKLSFHVPPSHLEAVKKAIFEAGAGRVGLYSHGAWEVLGQGQFMPLEGSNPAIGTINQLARIPEYKVDTVCEDSLIHQVIQALKAAHPYEEPYYQALKLEDL